MSDPQFEPASQPPQLASIWRRAGAGLIDFAIFWVATGIAFGIVAGDPDTATAAEEDAAGLVSLALLTVWFNYLVISEWRSGQTLGKLMFGLRVIAEDGGRPSWNRAVVRNLALLPDLVLAWFLIPTSNRRQRLGDRLGRTIVVKAESVPSGSTPIAPASMAPPAAPIGGPADTGPALPSRAWGPGRVLGGLAVFLVIVLMETLIVGAFDPDLDSLGATLTLQALLAGTMVAVAFVFAQPEGGLASPAALGLRRPVQPAIRVSVLAYLIYVGCALLIAALLQPEQEDVTRELGADEGVLGSIVAGLLIVIAAPISEEVFFRGFIFGGLRRGSRFAIAAIVSAAVWGVFHYTDPDSWGVVLQLSVFGVVLAWLYERTGSLWPPLALHAFNNALAFAILTS